MATTLASQLQAIRSSTKGTADPIRHPLTRPTILYGPKEAADIDLRTILPIALSGLDVLIDLDSRFGNYRETLFSQISLETDREKMVKEEDEKLNKSIHSYLRLLSGYLDLPASLKTLEYLIRRYQVHVYNVDELVLCSLPYHCTTPFVKIVQLLDLGNNRDWAFLEGVKTSGAPPPRKIVVQQCIHDKGVLEKLLNYVSLKKFQHASKVICFYSAVIVEVLGSIPELDDAMVRRVYPFISDGLNPDSRRSRDHKAGALMVVGLLATRATLISSFIKNLTLLIARVAQHDSNQSVDLPWIRVTIMALVSLAQSQSVDIFQEKTVKILKDIRDLPGILSGLSQEFHIQKFLSLYAESLVYYGKSDASCTHTLIVMLETLPMKETVEKIVSMILKNCKKLLPNMKDSNLPFSRKEAIETGNWAKKILSVIDKHYPSELHRAVRKFLEDSKMNLKGENSDFKTFCLLFDEGSEIQTEVSDSKFWFSLEHPKAEVRRAALSDLAASGIMKDISANPQKLVNVKDSLVRCLNDEDLSVVQATLSVGLAEIVDPACLLRAYQDVLSRCIQIMKGSACKPSQACDVAELCLERMVLDVPVHHLDYSKEIATVIFPLLVVLPKTWKVNLKALEIAMQIQWPFYSNSNISNNTAPSLKAKILESGYITTINLRTIEALAQAFLKNPQGHMQWLVECSKCSELAKGLVLFIILQASLIHNEESGSILKLYQACSSALRDDWHEMESDGRIILAEEFNVDKVDKSFLGLVDQLLSTNAKTLNVKVHICIYCCMLKACSSSVTLSSPADSCEQLIILDELFLFFASSFSKNVFRRHLYVNYCSGAPFSFLYKYFSEEGFPVDVQVESLQLLATICSLYTPSERSSINENNYLQILLGIPSLLVPLSNENKDIRTAAVNCLEVIYNLWCQFDFSQLKNGNETILSSCLSMPIYGEFLESIVSQKKFITSDNNFLPSLFMSMLSPSLDSLLVPGNMTKRFDQASKETILFFILNSALELSSYGKLVVLSLFKGLGNALLHVKCVKLLLSDLLERRIKYHLRLDKTGQELSKTELEILCLLLGVCVPQSNAVLVDHEVRDMLDCLIKALKVDGLYMDDAAVVQPCVAVLENLTCSFYDNLDAKFQDDLFGNLVLLSRSDNGDIRNAAKEALLRINFTCSNIVRLFELILSRQLDGSSKRVKREYGLASQRENFHEDFYNRDEEETTVSLLGSLLDILLLKRQINNRTSLVQPLFQVLEKLLSKEWLLGLVNQGDKGSGSLSHVPESITGAIYYAQQSVLLILKDITESLSLAHLQKDAIYDKFNINLLVECAQSTVDVSTCNHVFLLLSSVAKASPKCLSNRMVDIFTVIGESAVKQIDSHSQHVMEDLISTLVPCWLSETSSVGNLLQIFIKALPNVPEHRRLTLIVYLLRSLGVKESLGVMIFHLFHLLITRISESSNSGRAMQDLLSSREILCEWEYLFAVQLSSQYSCEIWFPSLVKLLQEIQMHTKQEELFLLLHIGIKFILQKLEDTELVFQLESGQNLDYLQVTLGSLMEHVVLQLQIVSVKNKQLNLWRHAIQEFKDCSNRVLKKLIVRMLPSIYFRGTTKLLEHDNGNVKKKALALLCDTIKEQGLDQLKSKEKRTKQMFIFCQLHLDECATSSLNELCLKIIQLISSDLDGYGSPVKLAAISSLEVLSKGFPSHTVTYATCLACIVKYIGSADLAISSACLLTTGALINVLGSKALPQLPHIMKNMLESTHEISSCPIGNSTYSHIKISDRVLNCKQPFLLSVLVTLEAVIINLCGFLNPYLEDILDLVMLHREFVIESDEKMKLKTATVRKLLTEKIPVRLMLPPLHKMYSSALRCGESSLCLVFEMLASITSVMDRPSIETYHVKIFNQCLTALDLRRQLPESVENVNMVEQSVIDAIIVLTMKLPETMFQPLFIQSYEWADSKLQENESVSLDRTITFYKLINKLLEKHRSLFVPYFKHLREGCIRHLTEDQEVDLVPMTQKRKKTKHGDGQTVVRVKYVKSPKQWHLRALILKSLYQCFLYDTKDLKFLDALNFEVLLKPIVSQIAIEPPNSTDLSLDTPSVEEVDESLILCLGQMAVTAGSDVLWKPLNHEVLMQTRNEKIRPKILGLKVIKYLVEHLKEEYLVFLAETIPFLGELLEDVELPVKGLAQEILKELENLSGESLRQYL